ncbi:MAG: adenylyltransferase/cytidyltransferase family protein [Desulfobacterales bacterium]|nr:adenylyltransferase/cytidyltransferase family protein [Desulfobacterales bacterium]
MKKVFVSGCYDILHAGHIQFLTEAKALGEHLTVCFASDRVLWAHKKRRSSIPQEHKQAVLQSLDMVDDVVIGKDPDIGFDFRTHFLRIRPDLLVVTDDDHHSEKKRELCAQIGAQYVVLPKTPPTFRALSTSQIVRWIRAPQEAPLRVDFAGGWLDVPRFSREGGFVVNCAISPLVSLLTWDYEKRAGLGGSGAWALLNGEDGVASELNLGVGWQDPAIIKETGLCVWKSGRHPRLHFKRNGDMLRGLMALLFTNEEHDTPGVANKKRNYDIIYKASCVAAESVYREDIEQLAEAVRMTYASQRKEGMTPLMSPRNSLAQKYCGGGWGGYGLYIFSSVKDRDEFVHSQSHARAIEPFIKNYNAL